MYIELTPEQRDEWRQAGLKVQGELIKSIRGDTAPVLEAIEAAKASCK